MTAFADISAVRISVVVPCYNQGHYLAEALESILGQSHQNREVIVVDDGSTDDTGNVAGNYPGVKYVHQDNQGLSAARNTGIDHSSGAYLVFLDADDWLFPGALSVNLGYLLANKEIGFVSGAHHKVLTTGKVMEEEEVAPKADHYQHLLQGNYIGMHAAVMYPRWVFDIFRYDTALKACEDYDLYLKIARKHPVIHHTTCIAAYRIHETNMSGNIPFMLGSVLRVLNSQQLSTETEKKCLQNGRNNWINYYCEKLYEQLLRQPSGGRKGHKEELMTLRKYRRDLYTNYVKRNLTMNLKTFVRKNTPAPVLRRLRKYYGRPGTFIPANRLTPYSTEFGYDRGGPVDRYYIENFLQKQALHIQGRVLEIGDNAYTLRFGDSRVEKSEVLHVDEDHPQATLTGDLSHAPHIPDNSFDCIILTQTLHLIYHYQDALKTCYRILKPSGKLLLTVPGITPIDHGEWEQSWLWSFTQQSVTRILSEVFPPEAIQVEAHGNVLVATAFLYGKGLPELKQEQLDFQDPHYQVIMAAMATKPGLE